ncbi:uncharacterized protein LOC113312286 [Papaver somniferum]|uniref:uncharacterized protein LOC113312286 n=1 Tax=Papaver somniferum TaxID=3469 RepID=UPI000E70600A|nr:uncharacterized protein LOC113312286 [Papaver somniferum]
MRSQCKLTDQKHVYNGYWTVGAQVLKLRYWEKNFKPEEQKSSTAFVWVQLPGLSLEYWKEPIVMLIGRAIGRPLYVDETTLKKEIGYYESVLVEIDLAKSIPDKNVEQKEGVTSQTDLEIGVQIPQRKTWKYVPKEIKNTVQAGFDICLTPKEKESLIHEDLLSDNEENDAVIPPSSNSANSIPPNLEIASTSKSGTKGDNLVTQNNVGGAEVQFGNFTALGSPSKFHVLVDVVEEKFGVSKDKFDKATTDLSKAVKVEPKVRVSGNYVKNLRLPGKNQMVIQNACDGNKANIWLLWHSSLTVPTVISSTKQAITVKVGEVLVIGIHAACLTLDKRELWEELKKIHEMNCPWLAIGDSNAVLSSDEKVGGRRPLKIAKQEFRDCLNVCDLIQAPKSGIQYSWCNNRVGKKRILCDLDKAFFNVN